MDPFHLLSASAARGNVDRALHQSYDQGALVFSGPATVSLRIGGGTRSFGGSCDRLVVQGLAAQRCFGF